MDRLKGSLPTCPPGSTTTIDSDCWVPHETTRGPGLYLEGHCRYDADVYQTAQGLAAALLAALASVPKERDAARQQLDVRGKRLADLRIELERPFEHEGRLADLLARQRRLQRQLDLDKDSAGASRMDAEDTKLAA